LRKAAIFSHAAAYAICGRLKNKPHEFAAPPHKQLAFLDMVVTQQPVDRKQYFAKHQYHVELLIFE